MTSAFFIFFFSSSLWSQITIIHSGKLIDGYSESPKSVYSILIEKDKIIDIVEDLPPSAKVELLAEPFVDIFTDREEIAGSLKNIGTKRADFVRIIASLWSPTTQLLYKDSVFVSGQNTKYYTGIKSVTSLEPGSTSEFKIIIPVDSKDKVSYRTYEVRWESYK